jgi:purine-binding chemotaxis protein CheW
MTTVATSVPAIRTTSSPVLAEVLSFALGEEQYAVRILHVQEIRMYEAPTRLPGTPAHVLGVINLRGVIVPIIDLRLVMGCRDAPVKATTAVVVLNIAGKTAGIVVDTVNQVVELQPDNLRDMPTLAGGAVQTFVEGLAKVDEAMLVVLNLESLVATACAHA